MIEGNEVDKKMIKVIKRQMRDDKKIDKIKIQNIKKNSKNQKIIIERRQFLRMLPSNEDKKNLIESMKKLTHHISNNSLRQKQIFDSLSRVDLLKIISNLSDENQYLRRISALFLAELFYKNDDVKSRTIKMLQIHPREGRICLNQVPQQIQKYPSTFKKCIELMKSALKQNEQQKFCWTINLDRKVLQIQFLDFKKYSSFTFLDPNRNIFGFTYVIRKKGQQIRRQLQQQNNSKEKSIKSIDSRGSSKKQTMNIGSSFYKNYLEYRNKKNQSPNYRDFYEKKDFNKPNSSRSHKNDYMTSSYHPKNTINNLSQYHKIKELSNDKIDTPVKRETYTKLYTNSLNQSLDLSSSVRNPVGTANSYRETIATAYRQPQTDRKHDLLLNRKKISDSEIFNNSPSQKNKYPQTTKNSSIDSHTEKFYKRVKQILKR